MTLQHIHSSSSGSSTLVSSKPTASAPACVHIGHVQLRDLIVCPAERGVVWYVSKCRIVEQDIFSTGQQKSNVLAKLPFTPVTLNALTLPQRRPNGDLQILLAAGGQDADLFLGLYSYKCRGKRDRCDLRHDSKRTSNLEDHNNGSDLCEDSSTENQERTRGLSGHSTLIWNHVSALVGSINNNVLLYLPPPSSDKYGHRSSSSSMGSGRFPNSHAEAPTPRLVVSNNDCTVKIFEVSLAPRGMSRSYSNHPTTTGHQRILEPRYWRQLVGSTGTHVTGYSSMRNVEGVGWSDRSASEQIVRYRRIGLLRLPVPVNHTSISPDGSTVLSCGDAATIYLHRILPLRDMNNELVFESLATYTIPVPTPPPAASSIYEAQGFPQASLIPPDSPTYLPYNFVNGDWVLMPFQYATHPNGTNSSIHGWLPMQAPPACFATAWSADGTRFAVAGQEGAVRVWDVRCSEPLEGACWETGPSDERNTRTASGSFVSSSTNSQYNISQSDGDELSGSGTTGEGPLSPSELPGYMNQSEVNGIHWPEAQSPSLPWGVRALKFSRNESGKEVLVFTEHVSRVHVVDADTFNGHNVLRIPHVQVQSHSNTASSSGLLPSVSHSNSRTLPSSIPPIHPPHPPFSPPSRSSSTHDASSNSNRNELTDSISLSDQPLERHLDLGLQANSVRRSMRRWAQNMETALRVNMISTPDIQIEGNGISQSESSRLNEEAPTRILPGNSPFTQSPEPENVIRRDDPILNVFARSEEVTDTARPSLELGSIQQNIGEGSSYRSYVESETDSFTELLRAIRDVASRSREYRSHNSRDTEASFNQDYLTSLENIRADVPQDHGLTSSELYNQIRTEIERNSPSGRVLWPHRLGAQNMISNTRESREDIIRRIRSAYLRDSLSTQTPRMELGGYPVQETVRESERYRNNAQMEEDISFHEASDRSETRESDEEVRLRELLVPPLSSTRLEDVRHVLATSGIVSAISRDGNHPISRLLSEGDRETRSPSEPRHGNDNDNMENEQDVLRTIETFGMELDNSVEQNAEMLRLGSGSFVTPSSSSMSPSRPSSSRRNSEPENPSTATESRRESSEQSSPSSQRARQRNQPSLPPCIELIESTDPLDIAGVCFDPTGAWMYVATADGITEWSIKGSNQCWWSSGGLL